MVGDSDKTGRLRDLEQDGATIRSEITHLVEMVKQVQADVRSLLSTISQNHVKTATYATRQDERWTAHERVHQEIKEELEMLETLARSNVADIQYIRSTVNRLQDRLPGG